MIEEPRCSIRRCIHLQGVYQPGDEEAGERPCCAAFPRGIPDEIAYGDNDHTKPYPGDHGIRYERDPEAAKVFKADKGSGHIDPDKAIPVSIPVADEDTRAEAQHRAWGWIQAGNLLPQAERVPIASLVATQDEVDKDRVVEHARAWPDDEHPIIVVALGDKLYVLDGHHRIEGALENGADDITAQVIPGDSQ